MIDFAEEAMLRSLLDGSELRLYISIDGDRWTEPFGYKPVKLRWDIEGAKATAENRIEFTAPAKSVAGWIAVRNGGILAGEAFKDGPYTIRIPGDAIRVASIVTLAVNAA